MYRSSHNNTYQSPAHLHAPAGPGRGYSSPHLPLPAAAGSQYPGTYADRNAQHPSQRPAQYAAGYNQSVPHLPSGPAGSPYGQSQGYPGVPGLYAQQQHSSASVGTVYPGQPQQHMYGYGSGAYTPTNPAASAATLHNAQQQQQNPQYYQSPVLSVWSTVSVVSRTMFPISAPALISLPLMLSVLLTILTFSRTILFL
ncbi:hypothetical protein CPB85DRAFT_285676 [Mucidula mucida]|nr:hypothetical protein CPB85DRAFT_285676 [Mucidula mucida]